MKLSQLTPNPRNPRRISDEKLEMLKKSLAEFGDLSGIVFNRKTKRLVGGHQRIRGLPPNTEVHIGKVFKKPTRTGTVAKGIITVDGEDFAYREVAWSEQKEKAANIAANKHGGEWDLPKLSEWLLELDAENYDMDLTGFDMTELENLMAPVNKVEGQCDEDEVPEHVEPKTKMGDLYQLGGHRLLCGDSTCVSHVEVLMNGEKADMVSTDPPYGMDLETDRRGMGNTTTVYNKVIGDSEPFDPQHIIGAFPETPLILWGADYYCQRIPNWSEGSPIVWAKAHSEEENKVWGSSFETAWVWPKKKRLLWFIRRIHMGSEHEGTHPTQKPTEITTRALELFDIKQRGIVVDLFGGSGSTLIACEKTNRRCFMMELDPHYTDVIVARWEKYTGKQAKLLDPNSDNKATPKKKASNG